MYSCVTTDMLKQIIKEAIPNNQRKVFYLEVLKEEEEVVDMGDVFCGVRPYPPLQAPPQLTVTEPVEKEVVGSEWLLSEKERVVKEYRDMGLLGETHMICFFRYYNPSNPRLLRPDRLPGLESRLLLPSPAPLERELMYAGSAYVRADTKLEDLSPLLKQLVLNNERGDTSRGDTETEWDMWANTCMYDVRELESDLRFNDENLGNGEMVIFSRKATEEVTDEVEVSELTDEREYGEHTMEDVVDDDATDSPSTPPLSPRWDVSQLETTDPADMSPVDTPVKLPDTVGDYFNYRKQRIVIRFFPKTSHEPSPASVISEYGEAGFSCGESGCFELELAVDQSIASTLRNLAHVLGVQDHHKLRLFDSYTVEEKAFPGAVVNLSASHAIRSVSAHPPFSLIHPL